MRQDPNNNVIAGLLVRVANAFDATGNTTRALPVWRRLLRAPSQNVPQQWVRMGTLFAAAGRHEQAVEWAQKALDDTAWRLPAQPPSMPPPPPPPAAGAADGPDDAGPHVDPDRFNAQVSSVEVSVELFVDF